MSVTLQKASFWKRISAYLFDFIIAIMLTLAFATGINVASGYDKKAEKLDNYYSYYEEIYGIDFDISEEEYEKLSAEEKANYDQANEALNNDSGFQDAHQDIFYLTMLMFGGGNFLAILLWYFVIPLFFGYGRTLGKKIFGIAVVRSNCVKVSNPVLFIRAIVGLYAIETMMPLALLIMIWFDMMGIVGLITIGLLLILQIAMLIVTQTNSSIHDLLTDTVVVDYASQQIFDTEEDLIAFKEKEHEETVNNIHE